MSLLSLCLKDSTDGEFYVSSGRVFQISRGWSEKWVMVLGSSRNCLKLISLCKLCQLYITNSWWYKWRQVFRCQRINHLIKEDELVFFHFSMRAFPSLYQTERLDWCKFSCSCDNTGSFVLNFSFASCSRTIIPYSIGIFKKRPYEIYKLFGEISCQAGILVCA